MKGLSLGTEDGAIQKEKKSRQWKENSFLLAIRRYSGAKVSWDEREFDLVLRKR